MTSQPEQVINARVLYEKMQEILNNTEWDKREDLYVFVLHDSPRAVALVSDIEYSDGRNPKGPRRGIILHADWTDI